MKKLIALLTAAIALIIAFPQTIYAEYIGKGVHEAYIYGYPDGTIRPEESLTRAMLVTVLWRAEGQPVTNYLMTFADVDAGAYYGEAVRIEERDTRYIKKPENFLSDGTYKDYLPDVYVKPEAIRKKTAADRYNAGIMSRDNIDFEALERELLERSAKNAEGII